MQVRTAPWKLRSATFCSWLVGLAFLVMAFAKAYDVYGFIEKATYYRALDAEYMLPMAITTIGLEIVLGWAMCVRLAPRWVAGCTLCVVIGFSGLIVYAWRTYGIEDCGCLGSMADTPPGVSLVKNGIMVLALAWVYWVPGPPLGTKRLFAGLASSFLLALGCWQLVGSQI